MYNSGGALEYIEHSEVDPETEKWERLFNYIMEKSSFRYGGYEEII